MDGVGSGTNILVQGDFETSEGPMNDKPIMVSFTDGGGIVGYTSFHNEANITNDAKTILLYFISLAPPA